MPVRAFSEEERRVAINLAQQYEVWMAAERALAALPYGMRWRASNGTDYLYEILNRRNDGRSLGRRSPDTERIHGSFVARRAAAERQQRDSSLRLAETCRLYRALRLPLIGSEAAEILREADRREMLGTLVIAVGTNAVPAYLLEAGGRFDIAGETDDFDLAWVATAMPADGLPVWAMLKAVDGTYTENSERRFQARNAKAFEVELLAAPSRLVTMRRGDKPRPVALPEQEWLLLGRYVAHVVVARDGSPARLVVPDPRWFALQKLWLADKPERHPLKKPKDRMQGESVLTAVEEAMPQFPLDAAFEAELPDELAPYYATWRAAHPRRERLPGWVQARSRDS